MKIRAFLAEIRPFFFVSPWAFLYNHHPKPLPNCPAVLLERMRYWHKVLLNGTLRSRFHRFDHLISLCLVIELHLRYEKRRHQHTTIWLYMYLNDRKFTGLSSAITLLFGNTVTVWSLFFSFVFQWKPADCLIPPWMKGCLGNQCRRQQTVESANNKQRMCGNGNYVGP